MASPNAQAQAPHSEHDGPLLVTEAGGPESSETPREAPPLARESQDIDVTQAPEPLSGPGDPAERPLLATAPTASAHARVNPAPHAENQPVSPLQVAASLVRNNAIEGAEAALWAWVGIESDSPDRGLGCVLLAKILADQERWAETLAVIGPCEVPETVSDLASYVHANALRGVGRPAEAIALYGEVAKSRRSPLSPAAGFLKGDALFESGQWRRAMAQYDKMLDIYPDYPGRPMLRYRIARCNQELGRTRIALSQFDSLRRHARPGSEAHRSAIAALTGEAGQRVMNRRRSYSSEYEHAHTLRTRHRRWPEALEAFQTLLERAPTNREKANVEFQIARTLASLDRPEEALAAIARSRRLGGARGELLSMKLELLRRLGRTEEAVEVARRRAGRSSRVQGLAAAKIYYEDGQYEQAYELYKRHLRTRHNRANQWLLAWVTYRAGHFSDAENAFDALVGRRGIRRHKAEYWRARAQMGAGKRGEALAGFRAIAEVDPASYYGIQATNRVLDMGEVNLFRELTGAHNGQVPSVQDMSIKAGSIHWGDADGLSLTPTPKSDSQAAVLLDAAETYGGAYPELRRAYDRYRMGLNEFARLELRIARSEYKRAFRASPRRMVVRAGSLFVDYKRARRGLWGSRVGRRIRLGRSERRQELNALSARRDHGRSFLGTLSQLLVAVNDPYWTRKAALRENWTAIRRGVPTAGTRSLFEAAFPLAFEEVLFSESARYSVSPFLMTALARVESGFNEHAISHVGARGLMQVMPVTGNLIAMRRGDSEFATSDLLDPRVSLSYGAWYMNELLTKFDGQEPLAIISYNCGPHRVQRWLARRGATSDTDEFIEEVPYRQSRRYVKSVLRYISIYRRTYLERSDLYVRQALESDYGANINW